jgi:hypothetical protein
MVGPGPAAEGQADVTEWPPDLTYWWILPAFESLNEAPALQAVVTAHFSAAVQWGNDRHQEHGATTRSSDHALAETTLVKNMERDLARTAQPFHLQVTVIPVDGQQLWRLSSEHVLVSANLLRDTAQYLRRITPVVEALI